MKALILAAGFGNRMQPLTNNKHKTLMKVDGECIIDRIISGLADNNVNDVVVVTGYRHDELVQHLQNSFPATSFQFVHNTRYRETNNIYSMALAFEEMELNDDLLLIESDLIFTPEVISTIIHSEFDNVALVSPYVTGLDGTVVQIAENRITAIYPPHTQDEKFELFDKYKTLNIYKFTRDFCVNEFKKLLIYYAKVIDDNCYYELILGILIYMQRQDIYCEIIPNDLWAEVDDPNDLTGAEFLFNKPARLSILEDAFGGYWNFDITDFCFIRNMYFPTSSMISEIKNNLPFLIHNYGSKQKVLNLKLSYVLQCSNDYLLLLNGASQLYPVLEKLFANSKVLIPEPTFGEYSRVFSGSSIYQDSGEDFLDNLQNQLQEADVAVVVNPNNPTGTTVPTDKLYELAAGHPGKTFIIDESFLDFSGQASIIQLLEDKPLENVMVLVSMSKSYGVPGIRLGYVYTRSKPLLDTLLASIPIWNANSLAEFYLEILLKNKSAFRQSLEQSIYDREAFARDLESIPGVHCVFPSGANFLMVQFDPHALHSDIVNMMIENDAIYIKEVSAKVVGAEGRYFRFAVRLPHENRLLVDALRKYLAN
jgi:histidinol-phosphate/aromatic aminotransferase/cobyric acid decarboxylase-like protein/choline kinase